MLAQRITRENAAELGRRGNEARARSRAAEKATAEIFARALAVIESNPTTLVDYRAIRLARVRKALDSADAKLQYCIDKGDSEEANKWASTVDKLAEQERLLAGRPAPKAEESKRNHVRQGARNSEVAAAARSEPEA